MRSLGRIRARGRAGPSRGAVAGWAPTEGWPRQGGRGKLETRTGAGIRSGSRGGRGDLRVRTSGPCIVRTPQVVQAANEWGGGGRVPPLMKTVRRRAVVGPHRGYEPDQVIGRLSTRSPPSTPDPGCGGRPGRSMACEAARGMQCLFELGPRARSRQGSNWSPRRRVSSRVLARRGDVEVLAVLALAVGPLRGRPHDRARREDDVA